jgi:ADP-ribose pyrophosphatase
MSEGAPGFRHLEDRLVHEGRIWHVAVSRFATPDGEQFERDIVRSPGAVAAVPLRFDTDGTPFVVLIRQYRPAFDEDVVELPAGMRDVDGEPPERTMARELEEEVGLHAGELVHLTTYYPSPGMTDSTLTLYLASDLTPVEHDRQGPEEQHMEVFELPLDEAVRQVERGEIRNVAAIVGLLMTERRLSRTEGNRV